MGVLLEDETDLALGAHVHRASRALIGSTGNFLGVHGLQYRIQEGGKTLYLLIFGG